MNSEGRSAVVLPCTETGELDIFGEIGDVLLRWEEHQTSEASPDEDGEIGVDVLLRWEEHQTSEASPDEGGEIGVEVLLRWEEHRTSEASPDEDGETGVDVLLRWEEQKTSEASPDENESSVNVDWDEISDSSSVNESVWDVNGLGILVKPEVRGSDTEPFSYVRKLNLSTVMLLILQCI